MSDEEEADADELPEDGRDRSGNMNDYSGINKNA